MTLRNRDNDITRKVERARDHIMKGAPKTPSGPSDVTCVDEVNTKVATPLLASSYVDFSLLFLFFYHNIFFSHRSFLYLDSLCLYLPSFTYILVLTSNRPLIYFDISFALFPFMEYNFLPFYLVFFLQRNSLLLSFLLLIYFPFPSAVRSCDLIPSCFSFILSCIFFPFVIISYYSLTLIVFPSSTYIFSLAHIVPFFALLSVVVFPSLLL